MVPITEGTRFGPYEVGQLLGAGGMGEVYRARDTRLNRTVAVKVLPAVFSADPDRVRRFEQESRAAAALNHPNIINVHDVGQHEATLFIVSELLEGDSLRDRLQGGPLPVHRAVEYAIQIADGLAAAHEKGIVHRDLKPENVFITRDERVKILDFGLVKLTRTSGGAEDATAMPTGMPDTEIGRVLGTVGYMAPEQVRGEPADHRADLFALGAILYEMLGGRRAFARESAIETLAAILNEHPPDLPALQTPASAVLERIVQRCMEKRPERRFESARDLAFSLQTLRSAPVVLPPPRLARRSPRGWPLAAGVALLLTVAGTAWVLGRLTAPAGVASLPTRRVAIALPDHQPLALAALAPLADGRTSMALSPDGSRLVYAADLNGRAHLIVRDLDRFETRMLPGTDGAYGPFFAPDGSSIAFFSENTLKRISLRGGDPATVSEARNPFGGIWMADDTIIFGDNEGARIVRVPASGGTPRALSIAPMPSFVPYSAVPGGRAVLLNRWGYGTPDYARIEALLLGTGEHKLLLEGGSHPIYVETGHLLFLRGGSLFAAPFDAERLEITGAPVPLLNGIRTEQSGPGQIALARDGTFAYVEGSPMWVGTPAWVDRSGNIEPVGMPLQAYGQPRVSPDGRRIATVVRGATSDIWIYEVGRGTFIRLTQDGASDLPLWTPDGTRITYLTANDGELHIISKAADGSGREEILWSGPGTAPWSWSPDGKTLALQCGPAGDDICLLALDGDRQPQPFASTPFAEWGAAFSPDGQSIAYTSDASGRYEVYVRPYPGPGGQWQISTGGGEEPVWSRDGRELFYRNGFDFMVVPIRSGPEFGVEPPRLLFRGPYLNVSGFSHDIAPDGKRFLLVKGPDERRVTSVNVIFNWFGDLRRPLP